MQASPLPEFTELQLSEFNGDSSKPIYVAINGTVYDVSPYRAQYEPGGVLASFSGTEVTESTVNLVLDQTLDLTSDTSTDDPSKLTPDALLARATENFGKKYEAIGTLVKSPKGNSSSESSSTNIDSGSTGTEASSGPEKSHSSPEKLERGTTEDYKVFVKQLVGIEPTLQYVVDFLEDDSTDSSCERCTPINGTVIAATNEHGPKTLYKSGEDNICADNSFSKLASVLQDREARRKLLICEDLRPLGALFVGGYLGLNPIILQQYLNREASFESRPTLSFIFDYPETYHTEHTPRFKKGSEFLSNRKWARPGTTFRVWKNIYVVFHRIVWTVAYDIDTDAYIHLLLLDSQESPKDKSTKHLGAQLPSYRRGTSNNRHGALRSCRVSLEEAFLSLQRFDQAYPAPNSLEQEMKSSDQIQQAILAFLVSKWDIAISRSQITISESSAPLSGALIEIQEVLQRKHDLEKLDRCISMLVDSVKLFPNHSNTTENTKLLESYRDSLKSWADQLERILQSLLGMLAVEESIKANDQAIRSKNLQLLAYIFIPISTISSIYGMNTREILNSPPRNWYFVLGSAVAIIGSALVAKLYHSVPAPWFVKQILLNPWAFLVDVLFLVVAFFLKCLFAVLFIIFSVVLCLIYVIYAIILLTTSVIWIPLLCMGRLPQNRWSVNLGDNVFIPFYPLFLPLAVWLDDSAPYLVRRAWESLYFFDVRHPLTPPGATKVRRRWAWTRKQQVGGIRAKAKKPEEPECTIM